MSAKLHFILSEIVLLILKRVRADSDNDHNLVVADVKIKLTANHCYVIRGRNWFFMAGVQI